MKLLTALASIALIISNFALAGPATATDMDPLETNKKLVTDFYQKVLFNGNADAIDDYIGDIYIQHNPYVADGKDALKKLIKTFPKKKAGDAPTGKIVRVIAEGDLVVLHVHNFAWPQPNGGAIVDIFRVKDGKIVEHWDVMQAIPAKAAHKNTMF